MEALDFGDYSENLNMVAHNNVALFEQYEPLASMTRLDAMNDDIAASYDSDSCAVDNLYMVPTW